MPQRYWRHTCPGIEILRKTARCPACGVRAEFDGWRYELEEAMAVYQYVTGLKPMGRTAERLSTVETAHRTAKWARTLTKWLVTYMRSTRENLVPLPSYGIWTSFRL